MARQELTMDRFNEIKRQLDLKIPVIQISGNVGCSERTVRLIRDGVILPPDQVSKVIQGPLWSAQVDWDGILREALDGHAFSLIWSERAKELVGYKAFLDQFHKKFPHYKKSFVVHRFFEPGERCEVDYAGDKVEWIDMKTGEVFEAVVFVGVLGFSQKIFAEATENQKGDCFVRSHVRMYKYFGGVPKLTVPDCLKQGVSRCHKYDPEINRSYRAMSEDFGTVIVPARPRKPKDKALVEGTVRIIMRLFHWRYRKHTFISLKEINDAFLLCCEEINEKPHTRFKISRNQSWKEKELPSLRQLPSHEYEVAQYKTVSVYDDSYVCFEYAHYSVPHQYRGEKVELKATDKKIEIYFLSERIALHVRNKRGVGEYVTDSSHLPDNARAYHESTPQNILSQAKFLSGELHLLIDELFKENALGHLRRSLGLVRVARSEIEKIGAEKARANIAEAIKSMNLFSRRRVAYFQELLSSLRGKVETNEDKMRINRRTNPNLRHTKNQQLELVVNNPK